MSSLANKPVLEKVTEVNRDKQRVLAIAFLFGDRHIIACSHGCLQVIEAKSGKFVGDPWQDKERSQICAVDVSPDGERVATGSKDGKIQVWKWNGKTAKIIAQSEKHSAAANCVCWSRHDGGAHIASGFDDGRVAVWPVASGLKNPMSTDDTRLRYIHTINYSHDGTQLLVSGYDREISRLTIDEKAQEVEVDEVIKICNNPEHVSSATWAVTTDRHAIVTGLTDGKIKILELPEGRLLELEGPDHSDLVCAVVLFPDKRVLASASYDRSLRFWDLGAKRPIGQPLPHSADPTCVAFATNGNSVATGTCDGEVYLWDIANFLSSAMPTEDVNDRDGDATARPPFNPDSPIPTRQRKAQRLHGDPSFPGRPLNTRRPPISYGRDFFDDVRAPVVEVPSTATPSVSKRFSLSRRVKVVAVSLMQQVLRAPQTQPDTPNEMLPTTTASSGRVQESRQNHRQYQVASSAPRVAFDQQSGATSERTTQAAVLVRRTRWVNALLRMGCIPQYPEQMD
ncbi:WD40-repeat-containing domain protein [Suillus subluteus]|nr:WD40-repeat-containing domain protein [Suillus subluteus]